MKDGAIKLHINYGMGRHLLLLAAFFLLNCPKGQNSNSDTVKDVYKGHGAVKVTFERNVAIITLTNPPRNFLTVPIMEALTESFRTISAGDDSIRPRAILLRSGLDQIFCAGIDPMAVLNVDFSGRKKVFLAFRNLMEAALLSGVPIVVDINGPAHGGGAIFSLTADLTIIRGGSGKIHFPEIATGVPLTRSLQELMASKITPGARFEIMILGKVVEAEEAVAVGLANKIYSNNTERDKYLRDYLEQIVSLPPSVVKQTLLDGRHNLRQIMEELHQEFEKFTQFLNDDYVKKVKATIQAKSL